MAKRKQHDAEQIGVRDLENLIRRTGELKKQARSKSGSAGEMIRDAIEYKNLDRAAFAMTQKILGMIDQGGGKAATTLACFDYYRDVLKLDTKATKQGDLAIARQEAGEAEPAAKKPKAKKEKKKKGEKIITGSDADLVPA